MEKNSVAPAHPSVDTLPVFNTWLPFILRLGPALAERPWKAVEHGVENHGSFLGDDCVWCG